MWQTKFRSSSVMQPDFGGISSMKQPTLTLTSLKVHVSLQRHGAVLVTFQFSLEVTGVPGDLILYTSNL